MHCKVVYADSWNFEQSLVQKIKWASDGISGHDLSVLQKYAGEEFAARARKVHFDDGELPLHAIGLGAFEKYSANRNGDGFKEQSLRRTVNTFEKYAHYFKNHKNGGHDKRYGRIKLAFYNEPMSRVELLIGVYGTPKCAKDNGGYVNEDAVEKLHKRADISGSMACKLGYDVCSACGNKAKTRKDYCKSAADGGTCTLFGCATGLTKVSADGHVQHVDNPADAGLSFFDYSHVTSPADYIAYGNYADYLSKAASEKRAVSGSELGALFSVLPPLELCLVDCLRDSHRKQMKAAHALASSEHDLRENTLVTPELSKQPELQPTGIAKTAAWAALANAGVLLTVQEFGRQAGAAEEQIKQAATEMPGFYSRLIGNGQLEHFVRTNPYAEIPVTSQAAGHWALTKASQFALTPEAAVRRAILADHVLPVRIGKVAELLPDQEESELARAYASYKLAYYAGTEASFVLTPHSVILQNYACTI